MSHSRMLCDITAIQLWLFMHVMLHTSYVNIHVYTIILLSVMYILPCRHVMARHTRACIHACMHACMMDPCVSHNTDYFGSILGCPSICTNKLDFKTWNGLGTINFESHNIFAFVPVVQALCMLGCTNAQFWRCLGGWGIVEWCIYMYTDIILIAFSGCLPAL